MLPIKNLRGYTYTIVNLCGLFGKTNYLGGHECFFFFMKLSELCAFQITNLTESRSNYKKKEKEKENVTYANVTPQFDHKGKAIELNGSLW